MTTATEADEAPGVQAAHMARRSIDRALRRVRDIPLTFDRDAVGTRLHRSIQCLYAVIDSEVTSRVHYDGLSEAKKLAEECRALLLGAGNPDEVPTLDEVVDTLALATSGLALGVDAVAQIQLARRLELHAGRRPDGHAELRPLRASQGMPELHTVEREPLVSEISVAPVVAIKAPQPVPHVIPRPTSFEALEAFVKAGSSGELPGQADEEEVQGATAIVAPRYAFTPAVAEAECVRRLARDFLENAAIGRDLRKPNAIESWRDQGPFEARLCHQVDAFASLGASALPLVSLYCEEMDGTDPGRAFAAALTLGSIEGQDTVDTAIAILRSSQPETFPGWREGFALAPSPSIDIAMGELCRDERPDLVAFALDVLCDRGRLPDDVLRPLLRREEPVVVSAVVRALGHGLPQDEARAALESHLDTDGSEELATAALSSLVVRDTRTARSRLRRELEAPSPRVASHVAAWLLCLAGDGSDLDMLLAVGRSAPHARLLAGLGRHGHPSALPFLASQLHREDEELVAAAAEALERITGAGLFETVEEPWEIELPPEAEAALVVPIPTRKVRRVITDPDVWDRWLRDHPMAPGQRHRGGRPFHPSHIIDELESPQTPPERRHEAALELRIHGCEVPFRPDDWAARQATHLVDARAAIETHGREGGSWHHSLAVPHHVEITTEAKDPLMGTMMMSSFSMPDLTSLPFAGATDPATLPVDPAEEPPPSIDLGQTLPPSTAPRKPDAPVKPAMPWENPPAGQPRPATAGEPPAVSTREPQAEAAPASQPALDPLLQTVMSDSGAVARAALPFTSDGPPVPPPAEPAAPPPRLDGTMMSTPSPIAQAATPFSTPKGDAPKLTLDWYAWLSVRESLGAQLFQEALERCGMRDIRVWFREKRIWQQRLATNPDEAQRLERFMAHYRAQLGG